MQVGHHCLKTLTFLRKLLTKIEGERKGVKKKKKKKENREVLEMSDFLQTTILIHLVIELV